MARHALGDSDQDVHSVSAQSPAHVAGERQRGQRLGWSIVPVHFLEPQRHSQIFFRRAV